MIQFYNRILPKCGFVDLHNHTNDSYGEEMNRMNLSPEDLLESVNEYTLLSNSDATFAITDHNSIEGVQKVDLIIKSNPKKYEKVHFISGCEFTCSAGSLGEIKNDEGHIKNIFSNFHMLAYGFNPFDETLSFLCKLHSTKRANSVKVKVNSGAFIKVSAGAYVLSVKNILKDYGIHLSLSDFKDVNLKTDNIISQDYINYLMTYIEKFNLKEMIKKDIFYQLCNRNTISLGRLDCFEIMEVVENAGGVCVLAHPFLLKFGSYANHNKDAMKKQLKVWLHALNVKFDENDDVKHLALKFAVNRLSKDVYVFHENYTKKLNGIVGMEALHESSHYKDPKIFQNIIDCAKVNNLYITCGSDSHGTLKPASMLSDFTYKINPTRLTKNDIVAQNCLFASRILDGTIKDNLRCTKTFDEQITLVKNENNKDNIIKLQDYCSLILNTSVERKRLIKEKIEREKSLPEKFAKILLCGQKNIETSIFLMQNAIENNFKGKKLICESKKINSFTPPIKTALNTINLNRKTSLEKPEVQDFIKLYQSYKATKKLFKNYVNNVLGASNNEKNSSSKQQKSNKNYQKYDKKHGKNNKKHNKNNWKNYDFDNKNDEKFDENIKKNGNVWINPDYFKDENLEKNCNNFNKKINENDDESLLKK